MDAKYQSYYDTLKGIDFSAKVTTIVNGCTNFVNSTTKLESNINSSSWKELGLEQIKTVVIPAFVEATNLYKANIDVLANVCSETNVLVTLLDNLNSACSSYNNCSNAEEYKEQKARLKQKVNECETAVENQISKIKGYEGNIQDILIDVNNIQENSTETTTTTDETSTATETVYDSTTNSGNFVYYCQGDYKNVDYGYGKSIAQAGCGPTSLAMILTYFTGREVTPVETANYAMEHKYRIKNNGTSKKLFGAMCEEYGVKGEYKSATADNIITALQQGKKIIAHMGPGTFTKGGHYIVLRGLTSDGKVLVADPNHKNYNNKSFSASLIASESKGEMYVAG